ncbi:hypothetical protein ElyMa_003140600 [Elysia marginata]|uniref:Uncharacterized protein n=1 Tax=Elysia marginata TaxID=1093978 RepID=A0AAV4IYI9_9GAST|nr:hypothetical protein ElyMa_003140600 [Elysia marginata]
MPLYLPIDEASATRRVSVVNTDTLLATGYKNITVDQTTDTWRISRKIRRSDHKPTENPTIHGFSVDPRIRGSPVINSITMAGRCQRRVHHFISTDGRCDV